MFLYRIAQSSRAEVFRVFVPALVRACPYLPGDGKQQNLGDKAGEELFGRIAPLPLNLQLALVNRMALTRDDIAARVRSNLHDSCITYYSADDINDSIQDGYDEVVAIARTITNDSAITLTDETSYYNLASLISDYIHVVALFNDNTSRWFDYYAHVLLRELRSDWELAKGESEGFTVWDGRWISVFPRLTTASGTFTVIYKASANTLSSATVPSIPFQYERILEQ